MKVTIDEKEFFSEDDSCVCEVLGHSTFTRGNVKGATIEVDRLPVNDYGRDLIKVGMKIKITFLKTE